MILTEKQKELLIQFPEVAKHVDDLDCGELLYQLDDVILATLDPDYNSTKESRALQKLYDEIYTTNRL